MLLDFDEILVSIKNPQIKKYLQESITSYRIGNYRSAILAVWIAAMFDLVKKFEILVAQGEDSANDRWKKLKPKIENHQNWEKELIEAAKAIDMISRYELDSLQVLLRTRNRYAHPSFDEIGVLFDPTPEEVRYFIRSLYDMVLSQPAQLGAYYVNQLLERIKSPTFFTTNFLADELELAKDLVLDTINKINKKQIPRLIKDLFKSLNYSVSSQHELNILCFIVNLWDSKTDIELSDEVLNNWNNYIVENQLSLTVIEAILSYPEQINKLSNTSKEKIKEFLIDNFLKRNKSSTSFKKLLSYADVVPLAQSIVDIAPDCISIDKVIERNSHYIDLFGNKFALIFGKSIFYRTREVLKTRDGHKVNLPLNALRSCDVWRVAKDCLSSEEEVDFAGELIYSLNSNNFATMSLLSFDERNNIPIEWVKLLLYFWSDKLQSDSNIRNNFYLYFGCYLGLVQRHESEFGRYADLEKDLEIINNLVERNFNNAFDEIDKLESNAALWDFLEKLLIGYKNTTLFNSLTQFF